MIPLFLLAYRTDQVLLYNPQRKKGVSQKLSLQWKEVAMKINELVYMIKLIMNMINLSFIFFSIKKIVSGKPTKLLLLSKTI